MSAPVLVHDSLAELPEDKLVDRIVTNIQWGREFFQFYGMPSVMENRQCLPLQTAPGNPKGDIDGFGQIYGDAIVVVDAREHIHSNRLVVIYSER